MHVLFTANDPDYFLRFRGHWIETILEAGHDVSVLLPNSHARNAVVLPALRALGASTLTFSWHPAIDRPDREVRNLLGVAIKLRRLQPDLIIANTPKLIALMGLCARLTPQARFAPLVTGLGTAFSAEEQRGLHATASLLLQASLRRANHVFFQNTDDAKDLRDRGILPANVPSSIVNGSGVDLEEFSFSPLPPRHNEPLRLVYVGRLLVDKGIAELTDAVHRLPKDVSVDLRVVGDAPNHPRAVSPAQLGHDPRITYVGKLPDVREELRRAHIFVLPSYREGTPRSGLEALAIGRPILTTDVPGCREIVNHDTKPSNGVLVPARSSEALAEAIKTFVALSHEDLVSMSERSRALAEERFSVQSVCRQLNETLGILGASKKEPQ